MNSRYDPQDDPPEPTVDRVFPKSQCEVIPYTAYFPTSGPHNHTGANISGSAYAAIWWAHAGGGAAVPSGA